MTDNEAGAGVKGHWPDMRSLGWPPEGVGTKEPAAGAADPAITPFELAPDPCGTGSLVAVPVPEPPPRIESLPVSGEAGSPEAGEAVVTGCQAAAILQEVRALRQTVEALTAVVKALGESAAVQAQAAPAGGRAVVRSVSDHTARHEIQEYFLRHSGETLYPAEIADALNLPVLKVAELCQSMALRGQLSRSVP